MKSEKSRDFEQKLKISFIVYVGFNILRKGAVFILIELHFPDSYHLITIEHPDIS